MADNLAKAGKYKKLFNDVIKGNLTLGRSNGNLFIEAICAELDPVAAAQKLRDSTHGLSSLQECLRFDLSDKFLSGHASRLIKYISNNKLVDVESGVLLQAVLQAIVEPPLFWEAFQKAFRNKKLQEDAEFAFCLLLLRLLSFNSKSYLKLATDIIDPMLNHTRSDVRDVAYQIKHIINVSSTGETYTPGEYAPGGRHDNDFADFRQISILPTAEELRSKENPFLRPSAMLTDPETLGNRIGLHIDNQYRLLREDLLYEMREELDIAIGDNKKKHRGLKINGLELFNLFAYRKVSLRGEETEKPCLWGISLRCLQDLWPSYKTTESRKKFLRDTSVLKHQSVCCLLVNKKIVAFPSIYRDEDLLSEIPPVIVIQLPDVSSIKNTLMALHNVKQEKGGWKNVQLLQMNIALFAYEPILQSLQEKRTFPLERELLFWSKGATPIQLNEVDFPQALVRKLSVNPLLYLQSILKSKKSIILDKAQHSSLLAGLTQRVSLIQGPPGTGKSFIGALLGKIIHDHTKHKLLVICYTNHALDQFLEDLLDIGIPSQAIVRLGSKSTKRTELLSLQKQTPVSNFGKSDFNRLDTLRSESQTQTQALKSAWEGYRAFDPSRKLDPILEHLQFEAPDFYDAFSIPEAEDGMIHVGKGGKSVSADYLLRRWRTGQDAGQFSQEPSVVGAAEIWSMLPEERKAMVERWESELLNAAVESFIEQSTKHNKLLQRIDNKYGERDEAIIASKRIIGCTTTAAAKYRKAIERAHPNVVLVEEAGEILESHVLTALGKAITQLILIGDHKQLRPKVNNYRLIVEKGEGYDLNRSLFERLVLSDYPHTTLQVQHRMRPEISQLVRKLDVYPELQDAPTTLSRPDLRGVQSNIVFINHEKPEDDENELLERRDPALKSSKRNTFEAGMVLRIVRYLAQQGYTSNQLVILTPYLGQLKNLRDVLKNENDPILNDLDTHELLQAGLLTAASATLAKNPLRLATIDNYQGEESDIVIISLTRSNPQHDIGFMRSLERLTVLLSRARDALIMIGNMNTFMKSRNGQESWSKLFNVLSENGYLFDGFPAKCEKHPLRTALLKCSKDFDTECPNGGCTEPCPAMLSCNTHSCPSKCHQISDHSKMKCKFKMYHDCSKGHRQQYLCHKGIPLTCNKCEKEAKEEERRKNEEFQHAQRMAIINEQIERARQREQEEKLAKEREDAFKQKEEDLVDLLNRNLQPAPPITTVANEELPEHAQRMAIISEQIERARKREQGEKLAKEQDALKQKEDLVNLLNRKPQPAPPITTATSAGPVSHKDKVEPKPPKENQKVHSPLTSPSRDIWERRKQIEGVANSAIDGIMAMTGLEEVKKQVLRILDKIETVTRQGSDLKGERFNVAMLGNPGTGKTTIARLYAKFLASVQVISSDAFVETTGSRLCLDGPTKVQQQIDQMLSKGGGTFFIDEAYQLVGPSNASGSQVLDFLLAEMENHIGKLIFIFAGYNKEMEKFFEHNPGLISRVPYRLQFHDYTDQELLDMLNNLVLKKWNNKMVVEDGGVGGLYGRIAVRRLGQGRNTPGFGNARALANLLSRVSERQAERLSAERRMGSRPDDFFLAKEDLIGPEPVSVMLNSSAWKELQSMIGLVKIKESVRNLFSLLQMNYQRELLEKKPFNISLNRAFLGSPGTGKTTVAKLYGQILGELGMLSNGELVVKNPADFIGAHLGQSESQTKAILATTVGKVLVIDEAYMLHGKNGSGHGAGSGGDPYKTAVIDTLVAEIQNVPGEDRCVLLLGYKDQMEEMFQNVNPGLARRFSIENAFHFEDYSESELFDALEWKMKKQDLIATEAAKTVAMEVLSRMRNRPNFGNIGEVENLLTQAKLRFQARQGDPLTSQAAVTPFEPIDFDPDYKRNENARTNLKKLFDGVVGADLIIEKLDKWQTMATNLKKHGLDMRKEIPTTFVFKGPPGTGKTTTARKIGHVYYDMGFLASSEVVECSASDLVGQYVGQTGPKTKQLFEKALGRVLFIDEAYRLREGHFAHEAVDELVGLLTQDRYRGKLIVVLAGYDKEINDLLALNPGLSSRFPEEIVFPSFSAEHCLQILRNQLEPKKIQIAALEDKDSAAYSEMVGIVEKMAMLPSWGNARDIETLAKSIVTAVFSTPTSDSNQPNLILCNDEALECFRSLYKTKQERESNVHGQNAKFIEKEPIQLPPAPILPSVSTTSSSERSTKSPPKPPPDVEQPSDYYGKVQRDAGVSDAVWQQLQIDKEKQEREENNARETIKAVEQEISRAKEVTERAGGAVKQLQKMNAPDKSREAELLQLREQARLKELAARVKQAELENKRRQAEEERRREALVQTKLRMMGRCVAGFHWIKQAGGYRCAGGTHFVRDNELNR